MTFLPSFYSMSNFGSENRGWGSRQERTFIQRPWTQRQVQIPLKLASGPFVCTFVPRAPGLVSPGPSYETCVLGPSYEPSFLGGNPPKPQGLLSLGPLHESSFLGPFVLTVNLLSWGEPPNAPGLPFKHSYGFMSSSACDLARNEPRRLMEDQKLVKPVEELCHL